MAVIIMFNKIVNFIFDQLLLRAARKRTYRMDVSRPGDPMVVTVGPGGIQYQR